MGWPAGSESVGQNDVGSDAPSQLGGEMKCRNGKIVGTSLSQTRVRYSLFGISVRNLGFLSDLPQCYL